ncbi:MAG: protealysin inhibitor emfourin [Chloroflexota bacterium]
MRLTFERSGGFAGMRLTASVDTDTLPAEEAAALNREVAVAHVFDLPAVLNAPSGADQFSYTLTVEANGKQHTIEANEGGVPETLRPLLQHLTSLARRPTS